MTKVDIALFFITQSMTSIPFFVLIFRTISIIIDKYLNILSDTKLFNVTDGFKFWESLLLQIIIMHSIN